MKRRTKVAIGIAVGIAAIGALFIPDQAPALAAPAGRHPFVWGQDDVWARLEREYDGARAEGCRAVAPRIEQGLVALDHELAIEGEHDPDDPAFDRIERALFDVAPLVAACPAHVGALVERTTALRRLLEDQSVRWDLDDRTARDTRYRLSYGSRAALEEVLLQGRSGTMPALIHGTDEPSRSPSVELHGVTLHSGDILLSRGGAPTSAFIARGNDYPGNFSHVALLHVSEAGVPTVIESHIEVGVVTGTAEHYLEDTKLRIAVLRLRADHPALREDPLLPHHAASDALAAVTSSHIPYDFEMNWRDPGEQFCSEVASAAYAPHGVTLWRGLSSMSGEGLTRWLSAFGVRNFVTLGPSDLEHDNQVRLVAEWRDPDTLFSDHLDNAVLDVMLEGAERGDQIEHAHHLLPIARAMKAYSVVLNAFGEAGPVPEGMTATTGLRVEWLIGRHAVIRRGLEQRVRAYRREHGRRPPYWTLVALAREAAQ